MSEAPDYTDLRARLTAEAEAAGPWTGEAPTCPHIYGLDGRPYGWRTDSLPSVDVALLSLGALPRFTGQTTMFWSVLQHSYHAWLLAQRLHGHAALPALLHDAAEVLVGDIPSPLKPHALRQLEPVWVERLAREWGLPMHAWRGPAADAVHDVDRIATHNECVRLQPCSPWATPEPQHMDLLEQVLALHHTPDGGEVHAAVAAIIREARG